MAGSAAELPGGGAPELTFLGGAGTVTGSRYLLRSGGRSLLVDCGLFQGLKTLRLRNWEPFPVEPASIDAVVLTHAHIDHTGYLPVLVRRGFRGPVYCTEATEALCGLLLPDSARLEEQAAELANRQGYSKHRPALPLYTSEDADRALERFRRVRFGELFEAGGATLRMRRAGHLLGAGSVEVAVGGRTVLFSGDLGRPRDPLLLPPDPPVPVDWLVLESTYGDRLHTQASPKEELASVLRTTAARGGTTVIPAFAVGRAQTVLHLLAELRSEGRIPDLPVFVDSPMATDATRIFLAWMGEHRLSADQCRALRDVATFTRSVEESKDIDRRNGPMIVLSASGMATGGRVLFHLRRFAPDARNTVLFIGYQAAGTRGASMVAGAGSVKIQGTQVPVRAQVVVLDGLSGHADRDELVAWLKRLDGPPPRRTFLTHGEPAAADALRVHLREELGWEAHVPEHEERVAL